MCARVIQSSAPIRYAILDGMNVRDSRAQTRRTTDADDTGETVFGVLDYELLADSMCAATKKGISACPAGSSQTTL